MNRSTLRRIGAHLPTHRRVHPYWLRAGQDLPRPPYSVTSIVHGARTIR